MKAFVFDCEHSPVMAVADTEYSARRAIFANMNPYPELLDDDDLFDAERRIQDMSLTMVITVQQFYHEGEVRELKPRQVIWL